MLNKELKSASIKSTDMSSLFGGANQEVPVLSLNLPAGHSADEARATEGSARERPSIGLSKGTIGDKVDKLFDILDKDNNGVLRRQEVINAAEVLRMTEAEASSFFDSLDSQDHGYLTRAEFQEVRLRREEQVHGYPS